MLKGNSRKRKPYIPTSRELDVLPMYLESGELHCVVIKPKHSNPTTNEIR